MLHIPSSGAWPASPSFADLKANYRAMRKFVPEPMLSMLGVPDLAHARLGVQVDVKTTILFADICNFTHLSENQVSSETFAMLNEVFASLRTPLEAHRGVVDKFLGDGVLALFQRPQDAVQAALDIHTALQFLNVHRRRRGAVPLCMGMGINTGIAAVGVLGTGDRYETTVIGDAVNVASRVQGIAREVGCDVLVSESTHLLLPPTLQAKCRFVDRVLVKGRRRPVSVYEVFGGDPAALRAAKLANLREFENATTLYHAGHVAQARTQFAHCLAKTPTDTATAYYLSRIDEQARSGLPPEPDAAAGAFVWLPEYDTGVAAIDDQHHHLVHLLEELRSAVVQSDRQALRRVLPALDDYAREHFQMEQAMMAQVDYPLVLQHIEEHQLFLAELARLQRQFVDPASDNKVLRFKVETFLQDWLVSHTTKIDKHFVVYRQAQLANHH